MGEANPIVLVIDDDPEFRDSIVRLLRDGRTRTRQFSSVFDFLKTDPSAGRVFCTCRRPKPAHPARA